MINFFFFLGGYKWFFEFWLVVKLLIKLFLLNDYYKKVVLIMKCV